MSASDHTSLVTPLVDADVVGSLHYIQKASPVAQSVPIILIPTSLGLFSCHRTHQLHFLTLSFPLYTSFHRSKYIFTLGKTQFTQPWTFYPINYNNGPPNHVSYAVAVITLCNIGYTFARCPLLRAHYSSALLGKLLFGFYKRPCLLRGCRKSRAYGSLLDNSFTNDLASLRHPWTFHLLCN